MGISLHRYWSHWYKHTLPPKDPTHSFKSCERMIHWLDQWNLMERIVVLERIYGMKKVESKQ